MTKRRLTTAERVRDAADDDRRAWEAFRPRLEALRTMTQAVQLMNEAPPADAPGRRYHQNLGFFLGAFTVPVATSYEEKDLYLQFVQRLNAANELRPNGGKKVVEALQRAMAAQSRS
jgi:hypothetical protein